MKIKIETHYSSHRTWKVFSQKGKKWMIEYGTSAEYEYCEIFGVFRKCSDSDCEYWDSDKMECKAKHETVNDARIASELRCAIQDQHASIALKIGRNWITVKPAVTN